MSADLALAADLAVFVRERTTAVLGADAGAARIEPVATAAHHVVLLVRPHGSLPLVFKAAPTGSSAPMDVERTAAVMARARAAGVPVATVLAADASGRDGPWRYLLYERITGRPWRDVRPELDADAERSAQNAIADALLALQSTRLPAYGPLDAWAEPSAGTADLRAALSRRADVLVADPRRREQFQRVLDRHAEAFAEGASGSEPAATIGHDDLHHGNVLFRRDRAGWRLSGVLDWDKAWAAPAESDVARMALWDDMTGPGFWAVYRAGRPAAPGWTERVLIDQLLWCFEVSWTSPRHAADTEAVLRRLGETLTPT
ncbi:MAG: aminoglycoside phosphotransferase family protein [bacterium]